MQSKRLSLIQQPMISKYHLEIEQRVWDYSKTSGRACYRPNRFYTVVRSFVTKLSQIKHYIVKTTAQTDSQSNNLINLYRCLPSFIHIQLYCTFYNSFDRNRYWGLSLLLFGIFSSILVTGVISSHYDSQPLPVIPSIGFKYDINFIIMH